VWTFSQLVDTSTTKDSFRESHRIVKKIVSPLQGNSFRKVRSIC